MHTIQKKPITLDCFEIDDYNEIIENDLENPYDQVDKIYQHVEEDIIPWLEHLRQRYIATGDKKYWKELIRWLPESWLQKRTWTGNYENLLGICSKGQRRNHKLTEWSGEYPAEASIKTFMEFVRSLPYAKDFIFFDET